MKQKVVGDRHKMWNSELQSNLFWIWFVLRKAKNIHLNVHCIPALWPLRHYLHFILYTKAQSVIFVFKEPLKYSYPVNTVFVAVGDQSNEVFLNLFFPTPYMWFLFWDLHLFTLLTILNYLTISIYYNSA